MRNLYALLVIIAAHSLSAQEVVFQGTFDAESRWTTFEGDWKIEKSGEQFFVVFADNFEAKKAPDLKIFLSKMDFDDISGKNATKQSILITPLSAYEGKMKFEIPASINPSEYQSIIVHCEQYEKLWGGSPLRN